MTQQLADRTDYLEFIESELKLPDGSAPGLLVLDLFAGCGGLALGFEAGGFKTVGFEMLKEACATYNTNLSGECHEMVLTPGQKLVNDADIIVGGPPCQPFSVVGLQNGQKDTRDGFPVFLAAVEQYQPKIAIFENVRGMLYRNRQYLDQILLRLRELGYVVAPKLLNAVNFGVAQNRERLFVVAHRGHWRFPDPLRYPRYTAGEALGDLAGSAPENAKFLTSSMEAYVARYEKASQCIRPRDLHLEQPSRTVTCRNLNGATGDMLRVLLPDGRRRRLTVREGARLQSFPDWFEFAGSEGSQ
ncbi:MAG TPA: DNA cytosine methyltransferase, partial [Blastocatellia bacterium]